MSDKKFRYWLAVEESKTVRFSDLPHMMAKAMHPGEHELDSYAAARINLEGELEQAVRDGVLAPRNPAGLGRHTFPHGDALQRAVFIPRQDLEPFLNDRGIELRLTPHGSGPDYWTLENAAAALQKQLNWHDGARAELQDQMQEAASTGDLVILDPHTCLPTRSKQVHTYWELVTPESVNAWLKTLKAPYLWSAAVTQVESPRKSRRESKPWEALLPIYEPLSGLYMMVQAAQEIANAEGFSDEAWMELEADMRQAIRDEKLPVRSRHTGRVKVPDPSDFLLLVTVADVNKWLEQGDVPYRWKLQGLASEAQPAPSTAQSSGNAQAWTVCKPQRFSGYAAPLHRLLAAAHRDGEPRPSARDVVEAWRINRPAEVAQVLSDGFDYYDAKGDTKPASLDAIRKAIDRMTSSR